MNNEIQVGRLSVRKSSPRTAETAPLKFLKRFSANVSTICQLAPAKIRSRTLCQRAFGNVSLCFQARNKSCAEWPLLNRRLPIAQEHGVFCRGSGQGRKIQSNTVDVVIVYPQLLIPSLKAKAGKEVAGVSK
jgi:hypothetical protein